MAHLLLSAAHKSSGKTTIAIGLCAALKERGLAVQPFKKGPDYIDPLWLSLASGHSCHNLDPFLMEREEIRETFAHQMGGADIGIIEGNKGLHDGLDLDGSNSNAALAKQLSAPVILILDTRGMTRGIAPLILGYQMFDPQVHIAGVILNQVGGSRHEEKLRAAIERYTTLPVVGAVHHDPALEIVERHLGLVPSNEDNEACERVARIAQRVAAQVDLDLLLAIARRAPPVLATMSFPPRLTADVRIGIAKDAAFAFYYPGDLEALSASGAQVIPIDTLRDPHLPDIDGLFLGGGFPETHMEALSANTTLRREIRSAVEAGLPVYAECGGLMYLAKRLVWGDRRADMVGAIPGDAVMHEKPAGRGYVTLRETGKGPWPLRDNSGEPAQFRAHEFHYSRLENLRDDVSFAYEVLRGSGIDGKHDGIVYKNCLASYAHLRHLKNNPWSERFVNFVRHCKIEKRLPLQRGCRV